MLFFVLLQQLISYTCSSCVAATVTDITAAARASATGIVTLAFICFGSCFFCELGGSFGRFIDSTVQALEEDQEPEAALCAMGGAHCYLHSAHYFCSPKATTRHCLGRNRILAMASSWTHGCCRSPYLRMVC